MSAGLNHSLPRGGAGFFFTTLLLSPLLPACGGSSPPPPEMWPKGNIVFQDMNNYMSTTKLTIPVVATAPGADLDICWDGLMKDLLCHDIVAPNVVDNVSFLQIPNMSKADVEAKLAVGQLDENLVKVYGDYHVSQTPTSKCAKLSQFKLGDSIVPATDYIADANKTYMLLFETGTTPGVGSKAMLFLDPTSSPTSTATSVAAIDACSNNVLTFSATLGTPMAIPATDNTKWHVDWSQLTHDSFNNPVLFTKIDKVLIGFYQDKTAADLQANFKDIEQIATTLYEVTVAPGARDADLVNAKVRGGTTAFTGFNQTNGVWALAVTCGKCQVPAPILMSILQPTALQ
jgi:hypothetical protein